MSSKKQYITPLISNIVIDKTISIAMGESGPPEDPWGNNAPPPPGKGGNDTPPSQFKEPIIPNSFDDNPFK